MGLVGIAKNVNAQEFSIGLNLPVNSGAVGCWLGGSKGMWRNQIIGGVQESVIGSPVHVSDYSTQFSTTAYINTNIREKSKFTMLVIGKLYAPGGQRMQFFGNYLSSIVEAGNTLNTYGSGIVCEPNGAIQLVGSSYTGVAGSPSQANSAAMTAESGLPTSLPAAGPTSWRCMLGKIDAAGLRTIKNLTKGLSATMPIIAGNVRDMRNPTPYVIGTGTRGTAGSANAPTEMMLAIAWDRELTADEEATMYAWAQGFAARRGATV